MNVTKSQAETLAKLWEENVAPYLSGWATSIVMDGRDAQAKGYGLAMADVLDVLGIAYTQAPTKASKIAGTLKVECS